MVQIIKNTSLLLLLLFAINCVQAQNSYIFNKVYKPDTMNIFSPPVLALEDGFLTAGPYTSIGYNQGLYTQKLDERGEEVWFKVMEEGEEQKAMIGGGVLEHTHDGNFVMAASLGYVPLDFAGDRDLLIIKFNTAGEEIWRSMTGRIDSVENPMHIIPTSDGGYIVSGAVHSFTSNNRCYVLKVNSEGNKEWDRVYYPDTHGTFFNIAERAQDYLVSGFLNIQFGNYDAVVMSINKTNGAENWLQYIGGDYGDTGCLITVNDSNEIIAVYAYEDYLNRQYPEIVKMTATGDTLFTKRYDIEVAAPQEHPLLLLPDGGFIALFGEANSLNNYYTSIWRFTATGDTLWTRTIPDLDPNDNWYLKDIAATPDGGYILSGFNHSQSSGWVVKTDSLGYTCSYLGCEEEIIISSVDNTEYVETLETTSIRIAPNPAREYTTIHNPSPQAGNWLLYNALGQLVAQQPLAPNSQQQLPISHLPTGIYVWQFGQQSGRLVVRH